MCMQWIPGLLSPPPSPLLLEGLGTRLVIYLHIAEALTLSKLWVQLRQGKSLNIAQSQMTGSFISFLTEWHQTLDHLLTTSSYYLMTIPQSDWLHLARSCHMEPKLNSYTFFLWLCVTKPGVGHACWDYLASSPGPFLRGRGERAWYVPTAHAPVCIQNLGTS